MPEEPEEIDWGALIGATTNLADMVWNYYQALVTAGFGEGPALQIVIGYQGALLSHLRAS